MYYMILAKFAKIIVVIKLMTGPPETDIVQYMYCIIYTSLMMTGYT